MQGSAPREEVGAAADGSDDLPDQKQHHSRWIWVSALLAIVAVGGTIWALTLKSDLDDTEQKLDKTTQEQASTKQQLGTTEQQLATAQQDVKDLESSQRRRTGAALVTGKVLYDEFAKQLGAAHDELAATQRDVKDANKAATQAEKDAAAAKQDAADASTETAAIDRAQLCRRRSNEVEASRPASAGAALILAAGVTRMFR